MRNKIFEDLQDSIVVTSKSEITTHTKGHYENGYKLKYDLWTVVKGHIEFKYQDKTYLLKAGDFFLMYPNERYEATMLEESTFIYTKFDFSINQQINVLDNFDLSGCIPQKKYIEEPLDIVREQFVTNFTNPVQFSRYYIDHYFDILIIMVLSYITEESKHAKQDYRKINRLLPVIEAMHTYHDKNCSISYYSAICGMSDKYFISYFKEVLGITPLQYISQIRMQKAVAYLRERCYSIKQISYMLGFSDPYNFSTSFKKHFAVSPSKYLSDNEGD